MGFRHSALFSLNPSTPVAVFAKVTTTQTQNSFAAGVLMDHLGWLLAGGLLALMWLKRKRMGIYFSDPESDPDSVAGLLAAHFKPLPVSDVTITERKFPFRVRADLQRAVDGLFDDGVSAAFIKELMRRVVQYHIERDGSGKINREDIDQALNEMLFKGGSLNLKLLGATGRSRDEESRCKVS